MRRHPQSIWIMLLELVLLLLLQFQQFDGGDQRRLVHVVALAAGENQEFNVSSWREFPTFMEFLNGEKSSRPRRVFEDGSSTDLNLVRTMTMHEDHFLLGNDTGQKVDIDEGNNGPMASTLKGTKNGKVRRHLRSIVKRLTSTTENLRRVATEFLEDYDQRVIFNKIQNKQRKSKDKKSAQITRAPCSLPIIRGCLRQAFMDSRAKLRTRRGVPLSDYSHAFAANHLDCDIYQTFQLCFTISNCSEELIARTAAELYSQLFTVSVSQHTFLALRGLLRKNCSYGCNKHVEHICKDSLSPPDRDRDHAILLELSGQRLQLQLGMISPTEGCPKLIDSIRRWAYFRRNHCDVKASYCHCVKQETELNGMCSSLKCAQLKLAPFTSVYFGNLSSIPPQRNLPTLTELLSFAFAFITGFYVLLQ